MDSIISSTNYTYVDANRTYTFNFRKHLENVCYTECISKIENSSQPYGCCYGGLDSEKYDIGENEDCITFKYFYYGGRFVGTTYINVYCKPSGNITYNIILKYYNLLFYIIIIVTLKL
jgi:hypothetical protein